MSHSMARALVRSSPSWYTRATSSSIRARLLLGKAGARRPSAGVSTKGAGPRPTDPTVAAAAAAAMASTAGGLPRREVVLVVLQLHVQLLLLRAAHHALLPRGRHHTHGLVHTLHPRSARHRQRRAQAAG